MAKQKKKKNGFTRFTQKMSRKLAVLFVMILVAFAFLGIRLFIINRNDGDKSKKRVLSQQAYDSITIPATKPRPPNVKAGIAIIPQSSAKPILSMFNIMYLLFHKLP